MSCLIDVPGGGVLFFLRGDGRGMNLGERGSGRRRLEGIEGGETAVGSNI